MNPDLDVAWERIAYVSRGDRLWVMSGIIWWTVALHDFWCQIAIAALLHYGATFGGLYDADYDSYELERR